jgi:fibro-slime domain-containing protein
MKSLSLNSLATTTSLGSLMQLSQRSREAASLIDTMSEFDPTDQESIDRLKALITQLLDTLFTYQNDLNKAEKAEVSAFQLRLKSLNDEKIALLTQLLELKKTMANSQKLLADTEMEIARLSQELQALEEDLKIQSATLADKKKECDDKVAAYQKDVKRRVSEKETLKTLLDTFSTMKMPAHVFERVEKITVGGPAQIVCAETVGNAVAKLTCPKDMNIYRVKFASFGTPEGVTCGNYKISPVCHAADIDAIESACLGKPTCDVAPLASAPDGCPTSAKLGWKITVVCHDPVTDHLDFTAIVRDFHKTHADFEKTPPGLVTNMVAPTLGSDDLPQLGPNWQRGAISSPQSFYQWFHDVEGVNMQKRIRFDATETAPNSGMYRFVDDDFFPIDNELFGNEGLWHNYHFTLEYHGTFVYHGGEIFKFAGDDDVWVYINKKLAIDLGGMHSKAGGEVNLDSLGLTKGKAYDLDFFFAERHTTESHLTFETNIKMIPTA